MRWLENWYKIRYSIYSPFYNVFVGRAFMSQRKRSIKLADIKPDDRVLLIGAGTGLDLHYLLHCSNIMAIDVSQAMLAKLQTQSENLGIPVSTKIMDAKDLSFPNESFDVVILHLIMAVIPGYKIAIKEVERVLKPGGTVMVFDKFLPNAKRANLFRRLINPLAVLIATNLNLRLDELIEDVKFEILNDEKAGWGGLLRIIKLRKLR
jgi:phosphatidylethanolamine/phosphatidyl-N-methylethanolamine N-methyltransferase